MCSSDLFPSHDMVELGDVWGFGKEVGSVEDVKKLNEAQGA